MPQPCLTEKGVEIMRPLKEVLEENKQAYIQRFPLFGRKPWECSLNCGS